MAPKRKEAAADGSKGAEAAADADDKPQKKAKQEKEKRTNEHGATVRYKSKPTIKDMERMKQCKQWEAKMVLWHNLSFWVQPKTCTQSPSAATCTVRARTLQKATFASTSCL
jgi:hypothetical protein